MGTGQPTPWERCQHGVDVGLDEENNSVWILSGISLKSQVREKEFREQRSKYSCIYMVTR